MSTHRMSQDGLTISTYAGPADHQSPHSRSRMMIQIDVVQRGYASTVGLTMDQWIDLVCFVRRLDLEGHSILTTPEV
jgi:hypothetical protein